MTWERKPDMDEQTLKATQKHFSKLGISYVIGTILIIGLQVGMSYAGLELFPQLYEKYAFLFMMLPMYIIAVPIMILLIKRVPVVQKIEPRKISVKALLGYFLIAYAGMYLSNIIGNMLASMIAVFKQGQVQNSIVQIAGNNEIWMNILVMVICAPIFEELLFRKLIIDRTVQYGEKLAIILSALMFGFYHGNIYQFCYAFVLGCVFGYVYTKTGNVKYTIILHMMINFLGSIASVLVMKASGLTDLLNGSITDSAEMTSYLMAHLSGLAIFGLYFLVIMALVIGGIVVMAVNAKKMTFLPATTPIGKGQTFKVVVCNVGMASFFLIWLVFIIYATLR